MGCSITSPTKLEQIETTIIKMRDDNGDIYITCSPSPFSYDRRDYLILRRNHDNYIELCNKINENQSYKISYLYESYNTLISYNYTVEDIQPCESRVIHCSIKGLVNTVGILDKDYKEAILNSPIDIRLITKENLELNKDCYIHYRKCTGLNYYSIEKVTF